MRLALRNRAFFFFSFVMPLIFLFGAVTFFGRGGSGMEIAYVLGAILTLTVMGSFWGLSVQLVTFREQGILRRFRIAPVGASAMLASSILVELLPHFADRGHRNRSVPVRIPFAVVGEPRGHPPADYSGIGGICRFRPDRRKRNQHHAGNADDQQPAVDGLSVSFRRHDSAARSARTGCSGARSLFPQRIWRPGLNPPPQILPAWSEIAGELSRSRSACWWRLKSRGSFSDGSRNRRCRARRSSWCWRHFCRFSCSACGRIFMERSCSIFAQSYQMIGSRSMPEQMPQVGPDSK